MDSSPTAATPTDPIERVITTVHGTFANSATWVEPTSKLGAAIQERLGRSTTLVPFRWSGHNRPAAREKAQQDLRAHLHRLIRDYPRAQHFVIAHSHGGNVALYAMRDAALRKEISGVACLATPFLVARRRTLGSQNTAMQVAGAAVTPAVLLALVGQLYLPDFDVPFARSLFLTLLLIGTFAWVATLLPLWRRYADRMIPLLTIGQLSSPRKLLLIRAPGDEAGAALAFFQFISQLNVRAYVMLNRRHELVRGALARWSAHRGRLFVMLPIGVLAYVGIIALMIGANTPLPLLMGTVLVSVGVLVMLPALLLLRRPDIAAAPVEMACYLCLFGVICSLSVLLLPFGREIALASVFLDVTAETTPPGESTIYLLTQQPPPGAAGELQPLQHSVVYENDEAITRICDWLEAAPQSADSL